MVQVLKKPLLTEKNTVHQSAGIYAFEVDRRASKDQVRAAIEKAFGVKVLKVRTMVCRDRARSRMGRQVSGVRHWKKALVQLASGEKIKLFEGV
ncbi:MAG TPA: 50S ribosomal protein L23 [Bdellovibrionales bacterium]|nr:50S ribosomal protein L23 [Bdellovibrionales bacterium]